MTRAVAEYLNTLPHDEARAQLRRCCGAMRWAEGMLAARPFGNDEALFAAAERIWGALEPADWRQAFAAHPRIGERETPRSATRAWSASEQAGIANAGDATRTALVRGNRDYEARFGHVFLICATGLTGDEMLHALNRRLRHAPDEELRVAAAEQAKITRLRLEKLVQP